MIDIRKYEENQAFTKLDPYEREELLAWFNKRQARLNYHLRENKNDIDTIQNYIGQLRGARDSLATLGILVEYNWPGQHRRKWFFPTYDDALDYEEWQFQCRD